MKIPRHWSRVRQEVRDGKGRSHWLDGVAWSEVSHEDATARAVARAELIGKRVLSGAQLDSYEYGERPLAEPVTEELIDGGTLLGSVTRNRYGALVLNCPEIVFVDIDDPAPPRSSVPLWSRLAVMFGAPRPPGPVPAGSEESFARIRNWASANPARAFRVYRTRAGFRLLFTDAPLSPLDPRARLLFEELGADPLYARLTTSQSCYRARLTPKPWRLGMPRPPASYPFRDAREQGELEAWCGEYHAKSAAYRVCSLVKEFGPPPEGRFAKVVDFHDRLTACRANCPLA